MKSQNIKTDWLNRVLRWIVIGMIVGSSVGCQSVPMSDQWQSPLSGGGKQSNPRSRQPDLMVNNPRATELSTSPAQYSFAELDGDRTTRPSWDMGTKTETAATDDVRTQPVSTTLAAESSSRMVSTAERGTPQSQTSSEKGSNRTFAAMPPLTEPQTRPESNAMLGSTAVVRGQSPQDFGSAPQPGTGVQQTTYQYPELQNVGPAPGAAYGPMGMGNLQFPSAQLGAPNELDPLNQSMPPGGVGSFPLNYADLDIYVDETQTGRINFGGAYNSDNGLVGQIIIDERNFDIWRLPRSWQDIRNGTAWRGAGQGFRMELVPGNQVQRYLVSFTEPYLLNTAVSLSVSGYYFDRNYFDWQENRLGGRVALGYRLTQDLSLSVGVRAENVGISDPRVNTSPKLNAALGDTDLYLGQISLINDTRDHPFLPTEGHYLSLMYSQGFGEVDFPRGDIELRRYRLLYQRPDGSGRHTLSFGTRLGFSGSSTPVFENYFAGGFSTMRGFDFRGAGPVEGDVRVGGNFQWLNTLEYMFPLTADDMIKGVTFVDFGTVEDGVKIDWDNFRVAPGFGFRVHMPAAGFGAPLAFDFAFPINKADSDDRQIFSFYMGVGR